jgi:hypothetical protein
LVLPFVFNVFEGVRKLYGSVAFGNASCLLLETNNDPADEALHKFDGLETNYLTVCDNK